MLSSQFGLVPPLPYVVFEVEYLWNGWIKKDEVNANLILYHLPNVNYLHLPSVLLAVAWAEISQDGMSQSYIFDILWARDGAFRSDIVAIF